MADTPEEQALIVAGSKVRLGSAEPMDVQEITDGGTSAICTRDAEVVGTYPVDQLTLAEDTPAPKSQPKSSPFVDDDDDDLPPPKYAARKK